MKRIYEGPSMFINTFESIDNTNAINIKSSVTPLSGKKAETIGMTVIHGGQLHS